MLDTNKQRIPAQPSNKSCLTHGALVAILAEMKPVDSITISEAIEKAQEELKQSTIIQVAGAIKDVMMKITNAKIKLARS